MTDLTFHLNENVFENLFRYLSYSVDNSMVHNILHVRKYLFFFSYLVDKAVIWPVTIEAVIPKVSPIKSNTFSSLDYSSTYRH